MPWFDERRRLYQLWLEREAAIVQVQILYYQNLIRFIDGYSTFNVNTGKTEDEADAFLDEHKFQRFNKTLLDNPKFTPPAEIIDAVQTHGASFEYIKSAHHPNRRTPKAQDANRKKLEELQQQLAKLTGPGALRNLWLAELREYDTAYKKAIKEGWSPETQKAKRKVAGSKGKGSKRTSSKGKVGSRK